MKVIEFLKLVKEILKVMSKSDIKVSDGEYINLYLEYERMRKEGEKYWYSVSVLSSKYGISEASVSRLIRRLSKDVNS